jgi:Raf kinase inhibitor-like YbhB/YbcL family protein
MRTFSVAITVILFAACSGQDAQSDKPGEESTMQITSSAFAHGGTIPTRYTCDGPDVSPPLAWSGVPEGTRSLILICDDPDAPMGIWVHWVVINIPPTMTGFQEGASRGTLDRQGVVQGMTDFRRANYGGPCPPSGTHRYYFKLYALDTVLGLDATSNKKQVESAMKGHILAEAQLMGRYARQR